MRVAPSSRATSPETCSQPVSEEQQDKTWTNIEQDSDVWCSDGTLIVIAEQTSFRVHRSMISRHCSPSLLDLAEVPDVDFQMEDVPEGCTVVRTSDSAHDMKHLLRILYDGYEPGPSYRKPMGGLSFGHLAAAARLAHKYEVHFVLEETKFRLANLFPDAFSGWESSVIARETGTTAAFHANDAIEAANLFRTVSWAGMLPSAIHLCCQLPPAVLLNGHLRADGTLERLSTTDIELCWRLQKKFITQSRTIVTKVFASEPNASCANRSAFKSRTSCMIALDEARAKAAEDDVWHVDPLGGLHLAKKNLEGSVCPDCVRKVDERAGTERKAFWEELVKWVKESQHDE